MAAYIIDFGTYKPFGGWDTDDEAGPFRVRTAAGAAAFAGKVMQVDANGYIVFQDISVTGNVTGPASSTDNAMVRFDGAGGQIIQNSGVIVDDSNNVTGVAGFTATGVVTAASASNAIRIGTSCNLTTPPAIGGTTPNTGKFTTLNVTGAADFDSTVNVDGNVTILGDIQQTNDNSLAGYTLTTYIDSANGSQIYQQKARGSLASPTIVQDHDFLANYRSDAYDGAKMVRTLSTRVRVTEGSTPALNDVRGTMYWYHGRKATASGTPGDTPNDDPEDVLMKLVPSDEYPRVGHLEVTGSITVAGVLVATGGITGSALSSTASVIASIDTDNNSTSEVFAVRSNGSGTNQFSVSEAGNIMGLGTLTLGSGPTTVTDSAGKVLSAALNTVAVAQGGSGAVTLTGLLRGNGTSAFTAITDSTTVGQVLRVTGSNTYAWGALSLSTAAAITGTLPVGNGGTGATTFTANGVLYGNTTSAVQATAQGAANSVLTANAGAPAFSATPRINALGVGTAAPASTGQLSATYAVADPAANATQGNFTTLGSLTGASSNSFAALFADGRLDQAGFNQTSGGPIGVWGRARGTGSSGTINQVRGGYFDAINSGAGTVTGAYSLYAGAISNSGGGAITTAYGAYLANQSVGTSNIQLYLAQSSTGSNNWALYQPTAGVKSFFNGYLGVGTSAAAYPLHVVGESRLLGAVTLGNASTDAITCTGRLIPRTLSAASSVAMNAGEIAYYSSNWYGATSTGTITPVRFLTTSVAANPVSPEWRLWLSGKDSSGDASVAAVGATGVYGAFMDDGLSSANYFQFPLPSTYGTGTLSYRVYIGLEASVTTGQAPRLTADIGAASTNDLLTSTATSLATIDDSTSYLDGYAATDLYIWTFTGNPTGMAAGDLCSLKIGRSGTHSDDTYPDGIYIIGVEITYS